MEMKIRFGDLVRNSGRPRTVTLWTKPEDSPALVRARKENRVLTVIQETGKQDHAFIGFKTLPGALYLEFPRALPGAQDARVIGLNYALIDEPGVPEKERVKPAQPKAPDGKLAAKSPVHITPGERSSPSKQPNPVISKPQPREFTVKVRRIASVEDDITVNAMDQAEAERTAIKRALHKAFKPGKEVRAEIVRAASHPDLAMEFPQ